MNETKLIGYVRKSGPLVPGTQATLKVSLNVDALKDAKTYTTSDGQSYIPVIIGLMELRKVMDGERLVTIVSQVVDYE